MPPECVLGQDCPGTDNECRTRTCEAGVCGVDLVLAGTPLAVQTDGDCYTAVCDGAGNTSTAYEVTDIVADGTDCTSDLCTMQGPTHPPVGGDQCRAVSILDAPVVMNDSGGNPVGYASAGDYAACGHGAFPDLFPPSDPPWLWGTSG